MSRKRKSIPRAVKRLSVPKTSQRTLKKIDNTKHYLVYRSAKTGKVTKYDKRKKLIIEVRLKKTKKVTGYLNNFSKPKKNQPRDILKRRFTRLEIGLKSREEITKEIKASDTMDFRVYFKDLLLPQVKAQTVIFRKLKKHIRDNGILALGLEVHTSNEFQLWDGYRVYTRKDIKGDDLEKETAIRILQLLRSQAIRTSGKKFQSKERKKRRDTMPRYADVFLSIGD